MPSVWIERRPTKADGVRYRVEFALGGRGSRGRYAGSFRTKAEALARKNWVAGELAALRVPDLSLLAVEPPKMPTLAEAVTRWRESRIDVDEGTRTNDRVNTDRLFKHNSALTEQRLDQLDHERWARLFAEMAKAYKRGTLKKSKEAFSMVYDHFGVDPNPVRDPRVKLPHDEELDLIVPLAVHIEAVASLLAPVHLLPYLMIDWTGLRLTALEKAKVYDLDEHRRALLARRSIAKNRKPVWNELHDVLFDAVVA
jgi:hypothetical protein